MGVPTAIDLRRIAAGVFEPEAVLAADIDTVVGAGHAVEPGGVDQDVEFGFDPQWRLG
jgi:hypothetical protein